MTIRVLADAADDGPATGEPEASYGGQTVSELKARYGELVMMSTPSGPLIFRRPSDVVYTDFFDSLTRQKTSNYAAQKRLALASVVFPSLKETADIFADYPGVVIKCANAVNELAGLTDDGAQGGQFDLKKL